MRGEVGNQIGNQMLRGGGVSQSEAINTYIIRASVALFAELVDVDCGYFGGNDG